MYSGGSATILINRTHRKEVCEIASLLMLSSRKAFYSRSGFKLDLMIAGDTLQPPSCYVSQLLTNCDSLI